MRRSVLHPLLIASTVAVLAAACSSGSSGGSPSAGSTAGGGPTVAPGSKGMITVGLLVDKTGIAQTADGSAVPGAMAALKLLEDEGWKVNIKTVDTASNPIQTQTAAKQLVQQDHVDTVISVSGLFFTAAPVFAAAKIPVIGEDEDGPEWGTDPNLWSVAGGQSEDEVTTTMDQFMKDHGVTTVGAIGLSVSPGSADSAQGPAGAAPAVGLKVGYIQSQFPYGSTDLAPTALAMKQHGVNGVLGTVNVATAIALNTAMKNIGVEPKVFIGDSGYGNDLLSSGPAAVKGAEDMYFNNAFEPVEMNTPSTQRFQARLKAVGLTAEPTVGVYWSYVAGLLLKQVLDQGAPPTAAGIQNGLEHTTTFTADGLVGPGKNLNPNLKTDRVDGFDNCMYMTQVLNGKFVPVQRALPICGHVVKGIATTPTGVVKD